MAGAFCGTGNRKKTFLPVWFGSMGGRLVASRQSLKLASSVRFTPSQPDSGIVQRQGCSALTRETGGSSPPPATRFFGAIVQRTRTPRYERGDFWVRIPVALPGNSARRLNRTRRSAPNAEIWGSNPLGPATFLERRPTGEV